MSQGTTFTGRVYLGTNETTSPSIRAVTGVPAFVLGDKAGDQAISDNGQIYVCDGAAWSPLVNANGQTTMTAPLNVQRTGQGAVLSGVFGQNTTTVDTRFISLDDSVIRTKVGIGTGTATITAENSTNSAPLPLNLAIQALQINGAAGTSGQVLTSAGAGAAPTWTTPAAASGITALTQDVTATGPGSAAATVVGMGGSATKVLFVIEGGQYATLQAAVNAASANTMILVGPKTTGDWGDVNLPINKNLIIAAISGAGPNKVVKTGAITYDLGTTGPVLNVNENEVYLYGLYIQGSFAGSAVTFTGGANYPGRLRLYGCYVLNTNAAGAAAITNSNAAVTSSPPIVPTSSLYLDGCVVSLTPSAAGSAIVQTAGYTLIRNRSDISGSLGAGATGYAINVSAGTMEIFDSYVSLTRTNTVATVNITGATTFVSAGYSTIYNSSNSAGAACVNIGTSGATFGTGDATLSAGTTLATAAVPVTGVAGGVYTYTTVSYGYGTSFAGALFTITPASQSVGRKILADVATVGTIAASPATAANLRTAHRFASSVAALSLPAMTLADDGLRIEIINTFAGNVTVTPSSGVARQMTTGGGQAWVWRGTTSTWYCTSNV